ncbi:orotidine 5'-phosphate decarboxylase [Candidatus Woesearchaeota archaeon]|nr:orotidine 5'-phosphate decarboxylase [Candidatus Woesearchaeota archaeon]
MTSFREKWLAAVDAKNSVLCAGLDPAEFKMGRREEGLPPGAFKLAWSLRYINAIAPYAAAVKPNVQFWKDNEDMESLQAIVQYAHEKELVVIDDSKLADIGATNDAGLYHAKKKGFDAVTLAPFAGNMEEAAKQAQARDIGLIAMCLMSNPEYEREKNKWVATREGDYWGNGRLETDQTLIDGKQHVKQYLQLARDANAFYLDGIVIGAPSAKNHIKEEEIAQVRYSVRGQMLVLLPGVGAQGGEAQVIWRYFAKDAVIVNVGRNLMLPRGMKTTPDDQTYIAKHFRDMLNELRAA